MSVAVVAAFDALLRHRRFAADHTPQVVVQLGMAPASKALGEWVAAAPGCRHVAVSPYGLVSDPRLVGATQVHAPIGVFDSGFGGLTVARALVDQLPNEDFVYLGDTARAPYGPKSLPEVREYALECLDHLVAMGVKALVIACNSASIGFSSTAR